jgi:hypothetical protein
LQRLTSPSLSLRLPSSLGSPGSLCFWLLASSLGLHTFLGLFSHPCLPCQEPKASSLPHLQLSLVTLTNSSGSAVTSGATWCPARSPAFRFVLSSYTCIGLHPFCLCPEVLSTQHVPPEPGFAPKPPLSTAFPTVVHSFPDTCGPHRKAVCQPGSSLSITPGNQSVSPQFDQGL